jgi:hypothetical protein
MLKKRAEAPRTGRVSRRPVPAMDLRESETSSHRGSHLALAELVTSQQ